MDGNIHLSLSSKYSHRFVNEWEQAARSGGRCSRKLHSTSSGAPVNFRLRKLCVCNQPVICSILIPRQGRNAKSLSSGDVWSLTDPLSYCISPHKSNVTVPRFLQPSSEESGKEETEEMHNSLNWARRKTTNAWRNVSGSLSQDESCRFPLMVTLVNCNNVGSKDETVISGEFP